MPTDVFSRDVSYGGAFSSDGTAVTFTGFGAGLLAQHIKYTYQQKISRIYEVGSRNIYLVAGRTQGNASMTRVMGPSAIMPSFYTTYGNVCNAGSNSMTFAATTGCGGAAAGSMLIELDHVVIRALSGAVRANEMIIMESMELLFLYMTIS